MLYSAFYIFNYYLIYNVLKIFKFIFLFRLSGKSRQTLISSAPRKVQPKINIAKIWTQKFLNFVFKEKSISVLNKVTLKISSLFTGDVEILVKHFQISEFRLLLTYLLSCSRIQAVYLYSQCSLFQIDKII